MKKSVKKILIIIAAVVLLFSVFTACDFLHPGGIIDGPALFDDLEFRFDESVFGE